MAPKEFSIAIRRAPGTVVVTIHGEIDRSNARHLEPVRHSTRLCDPVAGHHGWELQKVLRSLAAEAEHLARVAERLSSSDGLAVDVRQGVDLIAAELLRQVARYGADERNEAKAALWP